LEAAGFPILGEKPVFRKRCHNNFGGWRDLSQKLRCCLTDPRMSSLTL